MLRYVRIFLINFQQVLEERLRVFVWFLLSLFSPLLLILFWKGAKTASDTMSFSTISAYYLLLIVGGSLLMSHAEESIALYDIQEGRLATYLLKPFKYFFLVFLSELPYRVLQGVFGIVIIILFAGIFHIQFPSFVSGIINSILVILLLCGGLVLSHLYKMNLGFIAFWTTDVAGIFQASEMLLFIFAGYIVPLSLYPTPMAIISYVLPFSYIIYFPVAAVGGVFPTQQLFLIFLGQCAWIGIMALLYRIAWNKGVKLFTGVGQ